MKAVVYSRYGPPEVLQFRDVDKPGPKANEVLIEVRAASVNPLDWRVMRANPSLVRLMAGLRKPRDPRMGVDVAGRIEAVGVNATEFQPGDEVFGACQGAFAEYARAKASDVVKKPDGVTFEQAAALPVAGVTALQGLRDRGRLRPGQKVLINGAAGGVGTFAVQIGKWLGAEVTAVCSTRNVEMVRSLGADRVVDYTRENFTEGRGRYDLIFDCVGNHSLSAFHRVLEARGTYVMVGGSSSSGLEMLSSIVRALLLSAVSKKRLFMMVAKNKREDLAVLGELVQTGKVTPFIDRRYGLAEVPEAIRYLETHHARGKVVILPGGPSE
jgi:NADPH:quinone reductase-like Zn-dependent oxidoreductase